ncbi:hypothetical protein VDF76_10985 [Xanthomonas campestris pv. raphani]|nr:hypothetical protein [Xanthomonas campestris]MEA9747536.1 hypothetical protein [Xanthomonas campestris pv. raphani]MEA9750924.1 hypothetical protein [Xanthomonas campestris pv. raphani]MEA9810884.1 hypothetical protein [Xanthomonas campestris pv. raphani]MEA9847825.1 hypothetical protein [Xanthomonas campestris pv. raphani]MEA9929433.1 hypothetical protein [Xanthomonas campestris pv. raphani]
MAKSKEKIFRLAVSSLISSSLTSDELRKFVLYLDEDVGFRHDFFHALTEISKFGEWQSEFHWEELSPQSDRADGLLDVVVNSVMKRRIPKRELRSLLGAIDPPLMRSVKDGLTARELLNFFLSNSSNDARKDLLRELGMEVEDDLYLGGISSRSKEA